MLHSGKDKGAEGLSAAALKEGLERGLKRGRGDVYCVLQVGFCNPAKFCQVLPDAW